MAKKVKGEKARKDEEPKGSAMPDFYENLEPLSLYAARNGVSLDALQRKLEIEVKEVKVVAPVVQKTE